MLSDLIPNVTSTLAQAGATARPIFTELMPFAIYGLGIYFGALACIFIYDKVMGFFSTDYRMQKMRNEQYERIKKNKQLDADFELWKRAHK